MPVAVEVQLDAGIVTITSVFCAENYDPGWKYAGRVPALPPRQAPFHLVSKQGTMICHMTPEQLNAAKDGTPFFVHIAKTGGRALLRYLQVGALVSSYCGQ